MNSRAKGKRNSNKCIKLLEKEGWVCADVEKASKYISKKDLFNLWDVMAIKPFRTKLIQVKSNRKPVLKPYLDFRIEYPQFECEVWIHIDRKGFKIIRLVD